MRIHASTPSNSPTGTVSLLWSLSHILPRSHALTRLARHQAHALMRHPTRELALAAAETLALLLDATDDAEPLDDADDLLLDLEFDS